MGSSQDRILNKHLASKLTDAATAAGFIRDGMTVAMSGFTRAGNPKVVPVALAERIRQTGERCQIALVTGASQTEEVDGELAKVGAISRRTPYQSNEDLRRSINSGKAHFFDVHLGEVDVQMRRGFYGPIDVAVVEASLITEEGYIVPTTSVGNSPSALLAARQVIIEINETQPEALFGFHDVLMPGDPPNRKPIHVLNAQDRVGTQYMVVREDKVWQIV